jgi:hypothetical protein
MLLFKKVMPKEVPSIEINANVVQFRYKYVFNTDHLLSKLSI